MCWKSLGNFCLNRLGLPLLIDDRAGRKMAKQQLIQEASTRYMNELKD